MVLAALAGALLFSACKKDSNLKASKSDCDDACTHATALNSGKQDAFARRCSTICVDKEWTVGDTRCVNDAKTYDDAENCGAVAKALLDLKEGAPPATARTTTAAAAATRVKAKATAKARTTSRIRATKRPTKSNAHAPLGAGRGAPRAIDYARARMARVLVVDDSAMDRRLAGSLLAKRAGIEPLYAENGRQALELVASSAPDVVLTDLQMPEMDGLELVEAIRARHGAVPVVLMTAHGSEEIAVRALQKGAASYVSKRNLARELVATIENVLEVTRARHDEQRALACFVSAESHFELDNDLTKVPLLIAFLEAQIGRVLGVDETAWIQIGVALREALVNAIVHGNLEVASALRESDGPAVDALCARRAIEAPWAARRVLVVARHGRDEATFVIRDEGPGFDPTSLPDPTDALLLEQVHGRGILLIRTFMDEVRHNAAGNEITMVKRFAQSS